MDKIIDFKNFGILTAGLSDHKVIKTIRLLTVFGNIGSEVIFITSDDTVYGFGTNKNGCLGLDTFDQNIREPRLNRTLTGKGLIDIVCGYEHCFGLTSEGQCYGWGHNDCGRLGIGIFERSVIPLPIKELAEQRVVRIACGVSHTLALTSDGQVYSWGRNNWGQLGVGHFKNRIFPTLVDVSQKVIQISCGRHHSMALTNTAQVYVWGVNESGQLGIHPNSVLRGSNERPSTVRPRVLNFAKPIRKVICGPNHSLLLTTDGLIYGFGDNNHGQVGTGDHRSKYYPTRMNIGAKIQDIIANNQNDLSMAVSEDKRCFVWGAVEPSIANLSSEESVFNIYGQSVKYKITFRTIIITDQNNPYNQLKCKLVLMTSSKAVVSTFQLNPVLRDSLLSYEFGSNRGQKSLNDKNLKNKSGDNFVEQKTKPLNNGSNNENNSSLDEMSNPTNSDTHSVQSVASGGNRSGFGPLSALPGIKFAKYLSDSFDNKDFSDLVFTFGSRKAIYCHKTILVIRNKKFLDNCSINLLTYSRMSDPLAKQEIFVQRYSYESFYAFLGYLYGIEPNLSHRFIDGVLKLAKVYLEPELSDLCYRYLQREGSVNARNVCRLYENAFNYGLPQLERLCIKFCVNNWKIVCKSDPFQQMNDSLCERLMSEIFGPK